MQRADLEARHGLCYKKWLNPAHVPCWWMNNPTLGLCCEAMIGRADIEESKSTMGTLCLKAKSYKFRASLEYTFTTQAINIHSHTPPLPYCQLREGDTANRGLRSPPHLLSAHPTRPAMRGSSVQLRIDSWCTCSRCDCTPQCCAVGHCSRQERAT